MKQLLIASICLFIVLVGVTLVVELKAEIKAVEGLRENLYDNKN